MTFLQDKHLFQLFPKKILKTILIFFFVLASLLYFFRSDFYLFAWHMENPNPIRWENFLIDLPHDLIIVNTKKPNFKGIFFSSYKEKPPIQIILDKQIFVEKQLIQILESKKQDAIKNKNINFQDIFECEIANLPSVCIKTFSKLPNIKYHESVGIIGTNIWIEYYGPKERIDSFETFLNNMKIIS